MVKFGGDQSENNVTANSYRREFPHVISPGNTQQTCHLTFMDLNSVVNSGLSALFEPSVFSTTAFGWSQEVHINPENRAE